MRRVWFVPLFLSLLQSMPAFGGTCPGTGEAAQRMDEYFANPRAPATYRALAGMGDPRIEPFDPDDYHAKPLFGARDDWEADDALRRRMLPVERTELGGSSYISVERGECRAGYALWVAKERIAALGEKHPYVARWFATQRAVFSACAGGGGSGAVPLPPPLATRDPRIARLQRQDRAYQAASRLFYDEDARTVQAFRRLAASASPHAPIARYMLLVLMAERPQVHAQTAAGSAAEAIKGPPPMILVGSGAEKPKPDVRAIIAEAERILADPRLSQVHGPTQGLIGSLAWKSAHDYDRRSGDPADSDTALLRKAQVRLTFDALKLPSERLRSDPGARDRYARAAADVGRLHGDFPDPAWWLTGFIPEDAHASRAMAAAARTDRFAAWLLFPESPFRSMAWARAGRRELDPRLRWITDDGWTRDKPAWDIAAEAIGTGAGGWSWIDEMAQKALRCADDSLLAALPELFYHQVRRSLMYDPEGRSKAAAFAEALDRMEAWPWRDSEHHREAVSGALRFLVEVGRVQDARSLRDRLLTLPPADNRYDTALLLIAEDETRFAAALAREGGYARPALLNILPVDALHLLAKRGDVPGQERARFARVAWTRLYALGRPVPAELDALMRQLNPEITGTWLSRPSRRAKAEDRRLLVDVLRSPGMNVLITAHQRPGGGWHGGEDPGLNAIDTFQHSDNNWWCAWQPDRHEAALDDLLYREFFSGPAEEGEADPLELAGARRVLAPLLESSWLWGRRDLAQEKALAGIASAPKLLAERAIAWASGRQAEGQEEALALAVRATRYGCQRQGGHGAYSRMAFRLLHGRFAATPAAKRTPYWFD
jgi:hypothetical protein